MKIGVINQVDDIEKRVLLTPSDVGKLIKQGHSVYIESDSGSGAFFPDNLYTDVGAFIANGSDIFDEPDVILSLNSNAVNILDKITKGIQYTATKAYDNLPEAKTKSKWHWAQITILFILKIAISIIAFKLSWGCNQNASNYFLKVIYTFISTLFSEIYIIYYAVWRIFFEKSCSSGSSMSSDFSSSGY